MKPLPLLLQAHASAHTKKTGKKLAVNHADNKGTAGDGSDNPASNDLRDIKIGVNCLADQATAHTEEAQKVAKKFGCRRAPRNDGCWPASARQ